jgi:hypothetical protein
MGCVQCKSAWGSVNCDPCEGCGYCPEECECKQENVTENKKVEENMKFKYNFLTNTFYRLEGEYSYEISEDNYFSTSQWIFGFILGKSETISFHFAESFFKVYYQKANNSYQKTLKLPVNGEITFEFTENERIDSS